MGDKREDLEIKKSAIEGAAKQDSEVILAIWEGREENKGGSTMIKRAVAPINLHKR